MPAAALPDNVLRARYDALGTLEDWPGERTFISRCLTFDDFLKFGPMVAQDFATTRHYSDWQVPRMVETHPGLFALIEAAWPDAEPRLR